MKEIILIRHGKPASVDNIRVSAAGFAPWIKDYERAELDVNSYPGSAMDLSSHYVIASNLKRAQLSVEMYSSAQVDEVNGLFREMDIPHYRLPFKLKTWTWVYLCQRGWSLVQRQEDFWGVSKLVRE
ncbi:hypothetical protein [Alteromonas ponticola]|uniref:Histidine phosphatase family protein n=1 Tax=Alteromonas ponticola TaxID=2720613 RepID=A0ABX1R0E3_9ALTE|nr:hypothetical protein [Alteromonas ponticola]NMH59945.1 hypothetical protein [Alteromonas ponticola]